MVVKMNKRKTIYSNLNKFNKDLNLTVERFKEEESFLKSWVPLLEEKLDLRGDVK